MSRSEQQAMVARSSPVTAGSTLHGGLIVGNGGGASTSPTGDESILGAAGELKVPHAIGLHAWQARPLVGWIASRTNGPERRQRSVVLLAAGLWTAFLLLQALLAFTGSGPVPG